MEEKKYTAEEVLDIVKNMENSERWELLEKMYDMYYNTRSDKKGVLE
ncbi:hypothetical protein [Geobacillus phage GR1]|nr:hypothetical protein [Geobacillus phage GR1]